MLRLPLGCLCPWIERLNILGCRRSGYISGLLKFCVSASFWQFRDIKYFHFVFSRSLYICSHIYIFLFMVYVLLCNSYLFWRIIPSSPIALCTDSFNYCVIWNFSHALWVIGPLVKSIKVSNMPYFLHINKSVLYGLFFKIKPVLLSFYKWKDANMQDFYTQ